MPKSLGQPNNRNLLLASLPPEMHELIEPHLEEVRLEQRTALEYPLEKIDHIIFPIDCVGSMVAVGQEGRRMEVGLFGFDGMSGSSVVLRAGTSPNETFVQIPGSAYSIAADAFRKLLDTHLEFEVHFMRYVHCLAIQTAQTALSNGHATLEERLARWLLMCHDRVSGDRVSLTHEFLSVMLGVRRAGVTVATHLLEGKGLIRAVRGSISVVDRDGLEDEAKGSYGVAEKEYARIFKSAISNDWAGCLR